MKKLFLTSSIGTLGVAASIRTHLGHNKPLKTAFITTPTEVEDLTDDQWYQTDRAALKNACFDFFDYTISGKTEADIRKDLADIEVLYISGGNEFWLKHQSNKCNFGSFVKEFVEKGGIYIGTSAGSMIVAPDMSPTVRTPDHDNYPEPITDLTGFGIVDFLIMPHWGSDIFREVYLGGRTEKMYEEKWKIILLNNNQYVAVRDDWYRIVDVTKE